MKNLPPEKDVRRLERSNCAPWGGDTFSGLARFGCSRYFLQMKLVFLHGAPAAGKLTVARALLRIVPGRLFDNHAAIDLARTIFDFGTPGFWELVHSVRYAALDAAASGGVALVVTTFCYVEPDDRPQFETFEEILRRHDGRLLPVFLHCPRDEALRRVGNPDRAERRKMTSTQSLSKFLDENNFTPVPRANCLTLDTDTRPAEASAQEIVNHFRLHEAPASQLPTESPCSPPPAS
jgi:hypothetical protein